MKDVNQVVDNTLDSLNKARMPEMRTPHFFSRDGMLRFCEDYLWRC